MIGLYSTRQQLSYIKARRVSDCCNIKQRNVQICSVCATVCRIDIFSVPSSARAADDEVAVSRRNEFSEKMKYRVAQKSKPLSQIIIKLH